MGSRPATAGRPMSVCPRARRDRGRNATARQPLRVDWTRPRHRIARFNVPSALCFACPFSERGTDWRGSARIRTRRH
jgi:hypothetical protein